MKHRKNRSYLFEIILVMAAFFVLSLFVNLNRSDVKSEVAEAWQKAVLTEEKAGEEIFAENRD